MIYSDYKIEIIKSNRKTIAFQIKEKGILTIRAPRRMSDAAIKQEVERHRVWIDKHMAAFEGRQTGSEEERLSPEAIRQLAEEALRAIPPKVKYYAELLGVDYGRITIRNQKTRWGSCSSLGNLNFNCLLMRAPEEVLDYVIVHELCHRKQMNHSKAFWKLVEEILPDYKQRREWLKQNGSLLLQRRKTDVEG